MMKRIVLIGAAIALVSVCVSCGSRQKPSPRVNAWDNSETLQIGMNSDKVLVPFKRTSSGLAEVQVSLNGVPFNMWWDTGASITCISALELQKLSKEGKITLDGVRPAQQILRRTFLFSHRQTQGGTARYDCGHVFASYECGGCCVRQ